MIRALPVLFLSILLLLACEDDPSKDSDNPGWSVPNNPSRPEQPAPDSNALALQIQLGGQYIEAMRIEPLQWRDIGPSGQVVLKFHASGLHGIGQFDVLLQPDPAVRFNMAASVFEPNPPFVTMYTGVEQQADGRVRFVGVDLQRNTDGDAELGTLRLRLPSSFTRQTQLRLPVVFISVGPTSSQRDTYQGDDLGFGVVVNEQ